MPRSIDSETKHAIFDALQRGVSSGTIARLNGVTTQYVLSVKRKIKNMQVDISKMTKDG